MSRLHVAPICLLAAAALGCGNTTNQSVSQLNLDRPSDIAFGCFGGLRITNGGSADPTQKVTLSAQPTTACDIRSGEEVDGKVPVPPGQEDLTSVGGFSVNGAAWFGFVLQTGPGTVAIARFDTKPAGAFKGGDVGVADADPLTPGKNSISVGEEPIAIATDTAGCKVLTANAGSCDMSVLDINSAVDSDQSTPINVQRMDVKNATGQVIRAKPVAMVAEPASDVIGNECKETASGLVYVAYPSCHLVAAIDASTGTIVSGIRYTAGVPEITDGNVTCPDECGSDTVTAGTRPVTLDLEKDPRTSERRMVIGADNSSSLTVVELDDTTTLPLSVSQIALEDTTPDQTLGVTQLAMSPTIGMGGAGGVINDAGPGGQFQFVYAVATDHTVRVADILLLDKECDAQVDPRFLRDIRSVKTLSCLPVGDPATPPRRAGARGPGIQLVGDGVPLSVEVFKSELIDGQSGTPGFAATLIGYFGIITATNSATFVFNVDDDVHPDLFDAQTPLATMVPLSIAHQLRDAVNEREDVSVGEDPPGPLCDPIGPAVDNPDTILGGPRATTAPQRTIPLGTFASDKATELPGLQQFLCTGTDSTRAVSQVNFAAPLSVRDTTFPDLLALSREDVVTLTWEGTLSLDKVTSNVDGPQIRESQIAVDSNGMRIVDQTKPFCDVGVEKFDSVQLRGCDPSNGNFDCPVGYTCFVHPDSQVPGIGACMLENEADRLADACRDFLTTVRRYTVGTTESGALQLLPRKVTLRMTPVEGCTTTEQCDALADYQASNASSAHPVDETATDDRTWTCEADPLRAPVQTGKRCMLRCDTSDDCLTGTICQGGTGANKTGYCMESVVPPQACVNAPQRYEIRGGEAFVVIGQNTGFVHDIIADPASPGGTCIHDPNASEYSIGRIPLNPLQLQPCVEGADPVSGRLPDGTFEPNPCTLTVDHADVVPLYEPGTCTLQATPTAIVTRQAPAIEFRNRGLNLTIVDPTYPGDQTCILDRAGNLGNIPHVFTGYQIGFRLTAGFAPLLIPINPVAPVKVVRGPLNSIWVIDQGDFLSTSIATPSTRGKVFQTMPHQLGTLSVLQ